jgi:DNA-binding NarL/FixJ family response regulator
MSARLRPNIVLMDLRMPRCDGVEATYLLREQQPDVAVVVLTTYEDDRSVLNALRAGARGYLTKDASAEEIRTALQQVRTGPALARLLHGTVRTGAVCRYDPDPGRPVRWLLSRAAGDGGEAGSAVG